MVSERVERAGGAGLPVERVVAAGSAARILVAATARALRAQAGTDLTAFTAQWRARVSALTR